MDEEVVAFLMVESQRFLQKAPMGLGQDRAKLLGRRRLGIQPVARHSRRPAGPQEDVAACAFHAEEVHHHLLVVAAQKYRPGQPRLQVDQQRDHLIGCRAAVNVVTEKDQLVRRARCDRCEKDLQLARTPVDISNTQQAPLARSCRGFPIPGACHERLAPLSRSFPTRSASSRISRAAA